MMKEGFDWEREGDQIVYAIADAAEIDETVAEHVRAILEDRHYDRELAKMGVEAPFDEEACYSRKEADGREYLHAWNEFENTLKTRTRFFSPLAEATLRTVFQDLSESETRDGNGMIVDAGPGTEFEVLYRARVFQDVNKLKDALKAPTVEIGPPPAPLATAGRMNAHGVAVFYGATHEDLAVAEVRPPVGSRVLVGRFKLLRRVQLLDVRALQLGDSQGSVFDPTSIDRLQRVKFLQSLGERISRPVMPSDEPMEYLVTQAIADFLSVQTDPNVDGIIYPSVQMTTNAFNVVLFHESSCVERPSGSERDAVRVLDLYEDDGMDKYCVVKPAPSAVGTEDQSASKSLSNRPVRLGALEEPRQASLRLEEKHLAVHRVMGVKYRASRSTVAQMVAVI